ncbi:unnamed protein product [Heterobilharzia americana]|nr:unnamed protein product [Heterobilharzia americana]
MKVNSLFFISLTVLLLEICIHCCYAQERTFSIDENAGTFLKDGGPFQFISGSLYYHRIPFIYWTEQATRLNNIGISVVYSSIPWSYHCQDVSNCSFDGDRDVESFLKMLDDMKMLVVLKIGPYAEDNIQLGGLPPWLFHLNESMNIRSLDQGFVSQVTEWFSILLPKIKPFLYENGGPVIMIQIEENYGWYSGSNPEYFKLLKDQARTHLGDSVILTTADEYGAVMNEEDSLPYDGILMTYSEDWRLLTFIME